VGEAEAGAEADLRPDDAVAAVEFMVDAEHVHRAALALGNSGGAPGELGHDHSRIDPVSEHVAMVAIAGDDAVAARLERRLEADGDRFLADIEVAEAADQSETVKLAGALLEAADEKHLAVIFEQLVLAGLPTLRLRRAFSIGRWGRGGRIRLVGALGRCCLGHVRSCCCSKGGSMAANSVGCNGCRLPSLGPVRHCEERSDEAIQLQRSRPTQFWIASLRSQ
jgi:hypothetical protein